MPIIEKELWKSIDGFDGYEVSNHGKVRVNGVDLKQSNSLPHKVRIKGAWECGDRFRGYANYKPYRPCMFMPKTICTQVFGVHQLVAGVFLDRPHLTSETIVIVHHDGDKSNNRASNLKYMTKREVSTINQS